jgi:bacteriorhodopsin
MMTGVILSAFFRDMENKMLFYTISIAFLVLILVVGIKLKNKEEE